MCANNFIYGCVTVCFSKSKAIFLCDLKVSVTFLDVGKLFGGFCFCLFPGKNKYVCTHTDTHPPTQKIKKADLQNSLVERVSLRIKLESQDYLLKFFGLDQRHSNQIQRMVSDMWSPNVFICWNCSTSAFLLYIFMASANAARGLAAMSSLYLHRDLTSVIVLVCFFPQAWI